MKITLFFVNDSSEIFSNKLFDFDKTMLLDIKDLVILSYSFLITLFSLSTSNNGKWSLKKIMFFSF